MNVRIPDKPDQDISKYWSQTNAFIDQARNSNGKVVVHCWQGCSRSVTIILAYILTHDQSMSAASGLKLIRRTRPCADPNEGFWDLLLKFE